jgi:ankyrin repeat protein
MAPSDSRNPTDDHLEIIDLLISAGANINDRNKNGETALSISKKRKLAKIISKLETMGAID